MLVSKTAVQFTACTASLAILLSAFGPPARAEAPRPAVASESEWLPRHAPAVIAHWVDENGNIDTQRDDLKTEWGWLPGDPDQRQSPLDPADPRRNLGGPAVIVRIDSRALPASGRLVTTHAESLRLLETTAPRGRDPRFRRLTLAMTAAIAGLDFEIGDAKGGGVHHVSLRLTTPEDPPTLVRFRSCHSFRLVTPADFVPKKKDLDINPVVAGVLSGGIAAVGVAVAHGREEPPPLAASRHLFIGLACAEDDDAFYFQLIRSDDAGWGYSASGTPTGVDTRAARFAYRVYKEDKRLVDRTPILEVRTRDTNDRLFEAQLLCVDGATGCRRLPEWKK